MSYRRFEVVDTKFNKKIVKELLDILTSIDWNQSEELVVE